MPPLPLRHSVALMSKPGSFGAQVDPSGLYLPVEIHFCAANAGWTSVERFYLATRDFPEVFEQVFGWTPDQCRQAADELRDQLRGYVADAVLDAPAPTPQAFGATPGPDGFEE